MFGEIKKCICPSEHVVSLRSVLLLWTRQWDICEIISEVATGQSVLQSLQPSTATTGVFPAAGETDSRVPLSAIFRDKQTSSLPPGSLHEQQGRGYPGCFWVNRRLLSQEIALTLKNVQTRCCSASVTPTGCYIHLDRLWDSGSHGPTLQRTPWLKQMQNDLSSFYQFYMSNLLTVILNLSVVILWLSYIALHWFCISVEWCCFLLRWLCASLWFCFSLHLCNCFASCCFVDHLQMILPWSHYMPFFVSSHIAELL